MHERFTAIWAVLRQRSPDLAGGRRTPDRCVLVNLDVQAIDRFLRQADVDASIGNDRGKLFAGLVLGVPVESSRQHRAPTSGCTVRYTHSYASHARERAVLTDKALWAMNAVPERLSQRLGSQLIDAAKQGSSDEGKRKLSGIIGEFFGSALGATIKSLGGGA
jgi:hypothetical protein